MDVVYVLDASFWQAPHTQLDLNSALDVHKRSNPTHPGVAARRKSELYAARFPSQGTTEN